jgi:hypothetical protein
MSVFTTRFWKTALYSCLAVLLLLGGAASADQDYEVKVYDGENFQQLLGTFDTPGLWWHFTGGYGPVSVNDTAWQIRTHFIDRVSSIKLGKKAGVLLQGHNTWKVFKSDAATLGHLDNQVWALIIFDKTKQTMPDGASFTNKRWDYPGRNAKVQVVDIGGTSTRYDRFVPAYSRIELYVNELSGSFLDTRDQRYMYIWGAKTTVEIGDRGSSRTRKYSYHPDPYDIDDYLGDDTGIVVYKPMEAASDFLRDSGNRETSGYDSSEPNQPPPNLGGVWHSNLGDLNAKHEGSNFTGTLSLAGSPGVKGVVWGTVGAGNKSVKFNWFLNPFAYGTGELNVAADFKKMQGAYTAHLDDTKTKQSWNLWR